MDMIAAQLDDARARFTAIGPGRHGDSTASQSPGAPPGSSWRTSGRLPSRERDVPRRQTRTAAPQRRPCRRRQLRGRQGPGDRGKELPVVMVPPLPPGSAESRTNSLRACLTVRRTRRVAGWWQTWLDVLSEQVLRGSVWLGGGWVTVTVGSQ
jgi:hypothetical protein